MKKYYFGFTEVGSVNGEGIKMFHDYIMIGLIFIVCFVLVMLVEGIRKFSNKDKKVRNISHGSVLEIIWTLIPGVILMLIGIPSFGLLYSLDNIGDDDVIVKVIGNQWYWVYEVEDYIDFDSYMLSEEDLNEGEFRLLEVDNRLVLPVRSNIRLLVSSSDVLHSFAVPSFGLKIDACPGRLNTVDLYIKRPGVYYGQCSELCGVNHAFMPICIEGRDVV